MIKGIVFDMDDTLYLEKDYVLSGFQAVDEYLLKRGINDFYCIASELFLNGNRGRIFNEALELLNITYDELTIKTLIDVYREHLPNIQLSRNIHSLLTYLKKKYQLGLITDGYLIAQSQKVKALRLNQYIDEEFLIITDMYGKECWKPSSFPYRLLQEKMGLQPEQLVYIGDNVSKDFIAPKKLGWKTVQLIREHGEYISLNYSDEYHAHYKVQKLAEIVELFNL